MSVSFEGYLKQVRLDRLLKKLGASDPEVLAKTVKHFSVREGEKRDRIVASYFGQGGIDRIVCVITESLLATPKPPANAKILDVGAGSGFFTIKVAKKTRSKLPRAGFYAMDLTPTMLTSLAKKKTQVTPFIGLAENIKGSIEEARNSLKIPRKFDAILSTLMLHHSPRPEKVFESMSEVLKENGKAVIVDLCEHSFNEFRVEMGDVHLGFKPEKIYGMASRYFSTVKVEKIPGIC
jgi:SAM-dependent methyltransferase